MEVDYERRTKRVNLDSFKVDTLDLDFDYMLSILNTIHKIYKGIKLFIDIIDISEYDCNDYEFEIYKNDIESDDDYNKRIKQDQNIEKELKEIRRKEYLELKKEFEKEDLC